MPVVDARCQARSPQPRAATRLPGGAAGEGHVPPAPRTAFRGWGLPPPRCRGVHYAGLEAGRELLRRHNPHSTSFCVYYLHPSAAAAAAEPASTRQQVLVH
jgi:hypothetical protein